MMWDGSTSLFLSYMMWDGSTSLFLSYMMWDGSTNIFLSYMLWDEFIASDICIFILLGPYYWNFENILYSTISLIFPLVSF